jgi:hypothetical protein
MKIKGRYSRYLTVFLLLSILPMGTAMGFFNAMKVNLFSEMKGVVTLEGKPVAGAVITRTAVPDNGKDYTDSTTTDSAGRFRFERMEMYNILNILPGSSTIFQKVFIKYDGQQYLAWETVTRGHNKGELNEYDVIGTDKEIDIDLKCELTAEKTKKEGSYISVISGICNWEGQKVLN